PRLEGLRARGRGERRGARALRVARELALDVTPADPIALREDDEPLDEVGQLAHVARPVLLREELDRARIELGVRTPVLAPEVTHEALGEGRDVLAALG